MSEMGLILENGAGIILLRSLGGGRGPGSGGEGKPGADRETEGAEKGRLRSAPRPGRKGCERFRAARVNFAKSAKADAFEDARYNKGSSIEMRWNDENIGNRSIV